MVLCHAARNVRVMMLYRDLCVQGHPLCELRAQVLRMKIMGYRAWLNSKQLLQVGERLLEKYEGLEIFQIAYVLTQDGVSALRHAKRVLQLGATGKNLLQIDSEIDRVRNIPP
jgi:hypothetical protein